MMTIESGATPLPQAGPPGRRKMLLQGVAGAVTGAAAMLAFLFFFDGRGFEVDRLDHVLAAIMVVTYVLMAAFVGLGALVPRLGAKLLHVEDEAEVRYERRELLVGSAAMGAIAIGLLGLTLYAPDGGVIDRRTASILVVVSVLAQLACLFVRTRDDELNKLIVTEATAFIGNGTLVVFGSWAVLSHLGYLPMFTPLAFVAGLNALFLLGLFITFGRRGGLS